MLPVSSKNGEMLHPLTALFTATSATCVTGLTLVDPYTQFTFFGQAVLLTMIEIGGIGLLTLTNFFMFSLRKKLGLRTLRLAQENTNAGSFHNIRSLLQIIVATTLLIESIGAILLSLRFVPKYGAHGVWVAIFTSVSAYCNAGFDILGNETPFGSLIHYNGDVIVLYTVMALIFLGGIGFMVFQDLFSWRRHRHLMLHTKAMLLMSAALIAGGFLVFLVVEFDNPNTLGALPLVSKAQCGAFSICIGAYGRLCQYRSEQDVRFFQGDDDLSDGDWGRQRFLRGRHQGDHLPCADDDRGICYPRAG